MKRQYHNQAANDAAPCVLLIDGTAHAIDRDLALRMLAVAELVGRVEGAS